MTIITKRQIEEALKEYVKRKGFVIVNQLQNEVGAQIDLYGLVDSGFFRNSLQTSVDEEGDQIVLTLSSTAPYAIYLEYGTYDYWKHYGLANFPTIGIPKKKDLTKGEAVQFPKGMQPFAPFRRGMELTIPFIKKVLSNE